jgi:hypothetical protein
MDTKNYSLEKHLKKLSENDDESELLYATWIKNWKNLSKALQTIVSYFPHFSDHGIEHTKTLIKGIEDLLGRERIEKLGVTDTFLILMSALTHDIGMYLSYAYLEEEWKKPEMKGTLEKYANGSDRQISQAATLLLKLRRGPDNPAKGFQWAMEVRNAVTLIVAQQMRLGHPERSRDYLLKDSLVKELANNFHMDDLPKRYLSLIADVAYLHGADFDEVLHLPFEENGVSGDKAHPRFVACMIRLGDLLDMDSDRFNLYSLATLKEIPESSKVHYDKHGEVEHFLNSPEGIEVTFDCQTDASFRVACELVDMLKKEVEKQSHFWDDIVPEDLGGASPKLRNEMVKFKGSETNPDLRNLRFDISGQRTFEMLKGGAIYKNPGRVFIREIVQNALDATKLQIWEDMGKGYHLPYHLGNPERDIKCVEDIKFTSDIPAWVYEKYPVHLNVEYDDTKEVVRVVCEDWGTGISEESLIRMTNQVGASRKADKEYNETIKQMPYFLQPTAAFGLGLQTVFYVTDEFTVETHYPGEPTRRIVFRSSVDGSYCAIKDEGFDFKRTVEGTNKGKTVAHGTTVTIEIGKKHFGELFEISDEQVKELEKDTAGFLYYIPEEIDSYVKGCFSGIEFVPILYKSPFMSDRLGADEEMKELEFLSEEEHFRVYRHDGGYNDKFYIEENKFGSILNVGFAISEYYSFNDLCLRGVRVDNVGFSYLGDHFMGITWNLFSREADQLVTISRDSLLPKGKEWCTSTINSLMRDIIRLTYKKLQDECEECSDESEKERLLDQYFNLCVVNWNLPEPLELDYQLLDDLTLDEEAYSDGEGNAIKASDLFKAPVLITSDANGVTHKMVKKVARNLGCVFLGRYSIVPDGFVCSVVYTLGVRKAGGMFYQLKKQDEAVPLFVEMRGDWRVHNSRHHIYDGRFFIRCQPGFSEYKKIVVGEDAPLLGYYKPYHGNCWIYPFEELTDKDEALRREELYNKLKDGYIKELVPDYIVKLIQKYNALKNDKLTEEEIYDEYIRMILDFKYGREMILDFTNESEEILMGMRWKRSKESWITDNGM